MKLLSKIFSAVPGLALLGALAAVTYYGLKYVVGLFGRIDQQVAIVTAIAGVTVLLSVSIIASGMRWAKERESELKLRVEKNALYENVLQNWSDVLFPGNDNHRIQPGESLRHFEQQLLLRASPNVLKAYIALRKLEPEDWQQMNTIKPVIVKIIIEMRKDLGQSIQGLKEDDLMSLFFMSLASGGADNIISRPLEVKSQPAI